MPRALDPLISRLVQSAAWPQPPWPPVLAFGNLSPQALRLLHNLAVDVTTIPDPDRFLKKPKPPGTYSLTIAKNALEHSHFDAYTLRQLVKLVKPQGLVALELLNSRRVTNLLSPLSTRTARFARTKPVHHYSPSAIVKLVSSAGLDLLQLRSLSRLLPRALAPRLMVVARKPLRTPWQALCDGDHDRLPAHLDRLESWLPDLTALREPDGGSTPLWADPAVLGAKTLVLAPHPDDETIGAGGTITLSTAMGRSVDVAFLTDGRSSKALLKSESSEIRRREAVQACSRLGATPHFFAIPEGSPRHERRGANDALSRLITRLDPSSILVTGPDEKHPEHRWATSLLKRVLLENGWTGKVGFYEVWASIRPTHLVDITDVFEHKKSVIEEYDCALRTVDYVQLAFLLGVHRASGGGRPGRIAEALQMMTADDYRALKEAS